MLHKQPETFSYQIINEGSNRLCVEIKILNKIPLAPFDFPKCTVQSRCFTPSPKPTRRHSI